MSQAVSPSEARTPPESLLRNRNFILLWLAYAISALGDHLSEMALLDMQDWQSRMDSARIQAVMTFAFFVPFFLLGPGMGWIADRLPRKWVMVTADVIRAALMLAAYPILTTWLTALEGTSLQLDAIHRGTNTPLFSPWVYSAPLILTGVFAAMFSPSRAAMLPTLVRSDQIIRANALTNALGPLATILSFVLGGYLVVKFGPRRNFEIDGLTFLLSGLLIAFIRPPARGPAASSAKGNLLAGFRYIAVHHRVRELIVFAVVFWIAASTVRSVVPALVKSTFGGSIDDVGYYQGTLGIGILCGALVLSALADGLRPEIAISWSLIGAGGSILWLSAFAQYALFGEVGGYLGLFFAGFFGAGVLVGVNALMQKIVPNSFRGRVFGVNDVCSMGGLLLATGLLGIPEWPGIDHYVPAILLGIGLLLVVTGVVAVRTRLSRGRFPSFVNFWVNLNRMYCKLWLRARRVGRCTIPVEGPVIVAANHISAVDPIVLIALSPNRNIGFMVAREYYKIPLFGRLVQMVECVPVNRSGIDTASIKAALRHLDAGKVLGIFPQGGIRPPDDVSPPREGIGLLALRSNATVIPAYVSGVVHSEPIIKTFLKRQRAEVRFGKPVDLSAWRGREGDREAYREASEAIMAAVRGLR